MDRRDLQLNALLGITQAINNNVVEEDLFRIYRFTLLGDLKVTKMALFVHADERWLHQVDFGTDINWVDYSLDNRFDDLKESMLLQEDPEFSCFKWVIPILHKEQLLALLFVGDVEDATFIKALTNIIIVAIENKPLARQRQQLVVKDTIGEAKFHGCYFSKWLSASVVASRRDKSQGVTTNSSCNSSSRMRRPDH